MAILVNRETLYESSMNAEFSAAWAASLKAHSLASPTNKNRVRSKKKRKICGARM